MKELWNRVSISFERFLTKMGIGLKAKLIIIFLVVKIIPLILLTTFAWYQITFLGNLLRDIAVEDSSNALNASAVENIERMSTDTAKEVAQFLYARDHDILYLAGMEPSLEAYRLFGESMRSRVVDEGTWRLSDDGSAWVSTLESMAMLTSGVSTNEENNDMDGFHYRQPDSFSYISVPLYDEIVFIDVTGMERIKYVSPDSTKVNYPMNTALRNISDPANTYVKAENYYTELLKLEPGEIYVSDVIGAYVGTNLIDMYTPDNVANAAESRGYDIIYAPEEQAYAGAENPNGQRFEGIVRWATPVTDNTGTIIGYVSFALNHDHIMEFVDHLTPMSDRYTELPSAYEGNYAFIWDYQCRNIAHPRHHSIVGYDPETGDPQIPWLESSIYEGWKNSRVEKWTDYVADIEPFDEQSREKSPAAELTQMGLVGLDGRYLNNAPQCTGWMDLTADGGSGSFYILWSGIYKLNTAAAIPYYTGQYAPSAENNYSLRGFGFVAIGSGLEDFTSPAKATELKLTIAIEDNLGQTAHRLVSAAGVVIVLVILIAILLASSITGEIEHLIKGISRFRAGERQFRFRAPVKNDFGTLADSFDEMADSIVDSMKNPLCITDMHHKVIYINKLGLELCQMTQEEMVGSDYGDTSMYPKNSPYDPLFAMEHGLEPEIYFDERSGQYFKPVVNYFYDKDGWKIGYIIESHIMTDIILNQKQIESQRTLLDKIFTASPDLIWYQDAEGRFVTVNPRFASVVGEDPDNFIGKSSTEIMPSDLSESFEHDFKKAVFSNQPLYTEDVVHFADSHVETLDTVRTPIFDADGTLVGVLGFSRNVTFRVQMEQTLRDTHVELEKAVNDANRANEHKGEFLARMSHEIRTPMNAIIGLTNIVQKKLSALIMEHPDLEDIADQMDRIETSSQHLLGLLNDILDLTKIDAGKIELMEEPVELHQLADTVSSIMKPRCDEKNIHFVIHMDDFPHTTFSTDALRLRQVLINLLGNAVKFTAECGEINFDVRFLDREEGRTHLEFSIKDTGIGIAQENQAHIFQAFEQGGKQIAKKHGGTGLGLAISQKIVQNLGGEINLESELGTGSRFYFRVWLKETSSAQVKAPVSWEDAMIFAGKRLLLVDDVEINRLIVISLLEDTGIQIDEAANGLEALNKVKASAETPYDMILMDVQMPEMDGYEATSLIRAIGRKDTDSIPIIALTANAFKEDIDTALSYGMNAHISKPVELDNLMAVLYQFLGNSDS